MDSCSLLIPCHNAANYLPHLWETIQAQTVPFDEIICYDDGSTDNTADVARKLGAKVIQGDRSRGAAYARNQLAKSTKCKWFHFHDADDLLHAKYLEYVKSRITKDVDVVLCNVDWLEADTRRLVIAWKYRENDLNKAPISYTISHPIGGINGLYRREVFWKIDGFDESIRCWEDSDLHVRLAAVGANFAVVEEVLSFSLRHSISLSSDQLMCSRCRLKLLQRYAREFDISIMPVVAEQSEKVARKLLAFGDRKSANEAIKLCKTLGISPPTTKNYLLKIAKKICPEIFILQIQQEFRRFASHKGGNLL